MQTRVLQLKIRTLNRGKAERLSHLQQAFTEAVRLHLEAASSCPKPTVSSLHAVCYREARERFSLPASTIQQARDKALSISRSVRARQCNGKKASQPCIRRLLPLRLAAENLRVFPAQRVVRVTTPQGFLWLPIIIPTAWRSLCALPHAVSEFVRRGQDWYLLLAVKSEDVPAPDGPHFGLDVGVANIAVLSGPSVVQFWDGRPLRVNRLVHSWPFAQLLTFITYKAALAGVQVIEEDPRHTSQRCSRCGQTARKNRQAQAAFRCMACGYTLHADLNAARNLAARGACSSGVGSVTEPLSREVIDDTVDHGNCNLASSL